MRPLNSATVAETVTNCRRNRRL